MFRIPKPNIRNFYVQDGVAYTEDRTIVRRLKICTLFPFPSESLKKYLSSFGTIEEFRWNVDKREGWVLYKEPTEAAKALYCAKHTLNGQTFFLRASRSWEQPEEEEEPGRLSGYDLPIVDDVWRKVLDYLPLDSRLNFAASCQRFQGIYELESQRLSIVLKMQDACTLTAWGMKRLMRLSGKYIRRVEGGPLHPRWSHLKQFVQLLGVSCPNLAELCLHRIPLNPDHMAYLFLNSTGLDKLINLSLRRCEMTDKHLLCLGSLTNLRTLDLGENPGLLGGTLGTLPPSLEILKLSGCENLEPTRLSNLCALPLLRELRCSEIHMRNFNRDWIDEEEMAALDADEHVYRKLVKSCPMLEVLEISVCPYMDEKKLGGLSHLRTLVLRAVALEPEPYQVDNSMLMALVEVDSLRHLEFRQASPGFVDAVGLKIISQLKELRTLVLRNQHFKADELRELRKLNALEFLDLSDSPHLSNEIIAELAKTLGKLRRLKIKRCPLISQRLTEILREKHLLEVDV
ncbi:uncharacterized protein LOC108023308 [Drosophila biarmipes]|uniref:uncharacterized protein LOC108023308 n=1 Tax=Drosophila biarmipes TaxID=125945 RepID=UPI0007E63B95|nr:uncharacterized protein LOC108023308 [Drosophila biarmipes]